MIVNHETKSKYMSKWISSKEVMKKSKIKSCDLMHYRIKGELVFKKKGNAYFYFPDSVEKLMKKLSSK